MRQFLQNLLIDLERRANLLKARVEAMDSRARKELREYILFSYSQLEYVRRSTGELLSDPALGEPSLVNNQIQLFRRWTERLSLVDWFLIPVLERFNEQDRKLTQLCRRLAAEMRWQLPMPLVTGFSNQYYWTKPELYIIAAPSGENQNLLALPSICHEMGHILLTQFLFELTGRFLVRLTGYFKDEQLRARLEEPATGYPMLVTELYQRWKNDWLAEFASDVAAIYLVGAPYGWLYLRLCISLSGSDFHPVLGEDAAHPANDARMRCIMAALRRVGQEQAAADLYTLWENYLQASGETPPAAYVFCYPDELLDALAENVIAGCTQVGLKRFDERGEEPEAELIPLIEEAWVRFRQNAHTFAEWEQETISHLMG